MNHTLTTLISGMLFSAPLFAAELGTVTPEQLLEMQKNQNALVIDVRSEAEWQASGIIANSYKLQAFDNEGKFDQEKWLTTLRTLKSSPNQPVVLVCRSGNRSGKVGAFLTRQLDMPNVYHLPNGIQSWIKAGHPVSSNCLNVTCK